MADLQGAARWAYTAMWQEDPVFMPLWVQARGQDYEAEWLHEVLEVGESAELMREGQQGTWRVTLIEDGV